MERDAKKAVLAKLQDAFQPERAGGINAAIQLKLLGQDGGDYYLKIAEQKLEGGEGTVANPRVTISASSKDLVGIFEGKVDAMSAYFQGRIIVQGDLGFAMTMIGLFKR